MLSDGSTRTPPVGKSGPVTCWTSSAVGQFGRSIRCNSAPHNAGELCGALLHLIDRPNCPTAELVQHVTGPDFPTGGVLVEPSESITEAYATGRGSFRLRARWDKEPLSHGLY